MEITPTTIYWIMQADTIRAGIVTLLMVSVGAVFFSFLMNCSYRSDARISKKYDFADAEHETRVAGRWLRVAFGGIPVALFFLCVFLLAPSSKTLVTMYGVPAAITAAEAVELDATAKKSISAINKLLDTYLAEQK